MNRDNILKVREHILALEDQRRFNMNYFLSQIDQEGPSYYDPTVLLHNCGTCACLAGWTAGLLDDQLTDEQRDRNSIADRGRVLLGLDSSQADRLFHPYNLHPSWGDEWEAIPPRGAVEVLDHLLETGEIDWSIIGRKICYDDDGREVKA